MADWKNDLQIYGTERKWKKSSKRPPLLVGTNPNGKSRMKAKIVLIGVFVAIIQTCHATTVAYYRFDVGTNGIPASGTNTILDSSGNGLNATPVGSPIYTTNVPVSPIQSNSLSLEFNGASSRIFIPNYSRLALTNGLTLEAFINAQSLPSPPINESQIIFRGDDRGYLEPYFIELRSTNLFFAVTDANNDMAHVEAPITLYQWHHVAGTLDDSSGKMLLYIDGNLVASTITSIRPFGALTGTNPGLGIGNVESDTYAEYFNGRIDDVRISDTALSPNQFLNAVPVIVLRQPVMAGNALQVNFDVISGSIQSFSLLQANEITGPWTTNADAVLFSHGPDSYTFQISAIISPSQFYRVQSP